MMCEGRPQIADELTGYDKEKPCTPSYYKSFSLLDPTKEETMRIFTNAGASRGDKNPQDLQLKIVAK